MFSIFYYYGLLRRYAFGNFVLRIFSCTILGLLLGILIGGTVAFFLFLGGGGQELFQIPAFFSGGLGICGLIAGAVTYM